MGPGSILGLSFLTWPVGTVIVPASWVGSEGWSGAVCSALRPERACGCAQGCACMVCAHGLHVWAVVILVTVLQFEPSVLVQWRASGFLR